MPGIKDILPADYLWYMAKYGELGVDVRNVGFLTRYDENTYLEISFIGLVEPVSVCQQYRYLTCAGAYAYRRDSLSVDEQILDMKFLPINGAKCMG